MLQLSSARWGKRLLHMMPKYPFSETDGLTPFLSAKSTELIHSLHRFHLQKVNHAVMGGPLASRSLYQLIEHLQGDASQSLLLHHASQAWNIDFWMQGLQPANDSNAPIPALRQAIDRDFGSLSSLMEEFTISARSIIASGWTWLVRRPNGHLAVLNTYNGGCPIFLNTRAPLDKQNGSDNSVSAMLGLRQTTVKNDEQEVVGGALVPVLGLNMWEHAWIQDYGIHKEDFVQTFWKCVNWNRAAVILNTY